MAMLLAMTLAAGAEPQPGTAVETPDIPGGQDAPPSYVSPGDDVLGGESTPVPPPIEEPQEDTLGGGPVPREEHDDPNNFLPGRNRVVPAPAPVKKPSPARPAPGVSSRYVPAPSTSVRRTPPRPAPAGSTWLGPRYANSYGTWRIPPTQPNYGPGTGRSGPPGQRLYVHTPGYAPSTGGSSAVASAPSSPRYATQAPQGGGFEPVRSIRFNDAAPDGRPSIGAPRGVLMRLGIDPSTYRSGEVPASLLDRIRSDS
jgi:hypothetical protein